MEKYSEKGGIKWDSRHKKRDGAKNIHNYNAKKMRQRQEAKNSREMMKKTYQET